MALAGLAELHVAAAADKDHVAHREPRVEVGTEQGAGGVRAVDVDRQLGVEFVLDHDDAVLGAGALELLLEDREEVLLDLGGRRRVRVERRTADVGRRLLAPERDLLKTDEVGLRALDLARERRGALGELRALHLIPDLARAVERLWEARRTDRRREVRAEEQVPGHDRDLGVALLLGLGDRGDRHRGDRHGGGAERELGVNR